MNIDLSENAYAKDIHQQPAALQNTLDGLSVLDPGIFTPFARRLENRQLRQVVLTGMGSSYHALHPLHLKLIAGGISSLMIETSELVQFAGRLLAPDCLVVAVSQSGKSAETVQLLDMAPADCHIVGVTNSAESPLAQKATALVLTHGGSESTVSCKSYIATLTALALLADWLTGQPTASTLAAAQNTVAQTQRYLTHWDEYLDTTRQTLQGVRSLFLVGRGESLAAAGTGGLIIKEAAHFHAEGMSSAAFRHGPFEMVTPDVFTLVYAGEGPGRPLNANLLADIRTAGGKAELVDRAGETTTPFHLPTGTPCLASVLEILPAQVISVALGLLHGHNPGYFTRCSKVTEIL